MPFRGRGETVDQISRYIKCGVIFISWGRKSSDKVGVQYGGCGRVRTRSHDKRDETRVGCLSGLQLGKVRLKMRVEKLEQGVQVKGWIQGQRGDYRPSGGLRDWSGQFVIFFSPMPLLLAYGTMGIEMAIAPLWVKGKRKMTESSKKRSTLYSEKCHMSGKPNTCCAASKGQKQPST